MAQTKCLPGMLDKVVETVVSFIRVLSLLCLFLHIFLNSFILFYPKDFTLETLKSF